MALAEDVAIRSLVGTVKADTEHKSFESSFLLVVNNEVRVIVLSFSANKLLNCEMNEDERNFLSNVGLALKILLALKLFETPGLFLDDMRLS